MKKQISLPAKHLFFVFVVSLIVGCTPQYTKNIIKSGLQEANMISDSTLITTRQWVLPRTVSLYVPLPKDRWSIALRRRLKEELSLALNQSFVTVRQSEQERSINQALEDARVHGIDYVVYPQLAVYKNKISSLIELDEDFEDYTQLGFDRFGVLLKLYDVQASKIVDVTQVQASSGLLSIARSTPASLFDGAFKVYSESLVSQKVN
jgi:hypothetical protein